MTYLQKHSNLKHNEAGIHDKHTNISIHESFVFNRVTVPKPLYYTVIYKVKQDGTIPWSDLSQNFLNRNLMWEMEKGGGMTVLLTVGPSYDITLII